MLKVIVAMSGGVDSAVVAQLLKNDLYDVVGVFMRMHKGSNHKDAQIVAKKIGIDFKILDVQKEFKKKVIDYFVNEYKKGNTPNPCVECNKNIKFKILFEQLKKINADFIATGHYIRIKKSKNQISNVKLLTAKDKQKDQSYFLWQLKQKQLSKILFPLGDYTKEQVRGLAKKFKLQVHDKPESQDACFVSTDIHKFLKSQIVTNSGPIITNDGKVVGEHRGLIFYTIGQRKGIEIGGTGPYYVIRKDFKKNALIVTRNEKDLMQKELIIRNVNFISGKPYSGKCQVKIRSTAKTTEGTIKGNKIIFNKPQRAIASGQSAVIYLKNELIGGGIII
jgi:tRNA-specific 2-thiouridylase